MSVGATASASSAVAARRLRSAARGVWLIAAPLLLSGLAMRFLVPGRSEIGPGPWGGLALLGDRYPLPLAVGLFIVFTVLVQGVRDLFPRGPRRQPEADASTAGDQAPPRTQPLTSARTATAGTWLVTLLVAAAAALVVKTTVGQPVRVTSTSMLPTLEPSDYLLVNKLAYGVRLRSGGTGLGARPPRRGDIVVFHGGAVGERGQELLVKRVIGLPGDRIATSGGLASINGWQVPFCDAGRYVYLGPDGPVLGRLIVQFLEDSTFVTLHTPEAMAFQGAPVKPGEVFVLGDNRNSSRDSRAWNKGLGAGVPLAAIEGAAWRIVGWDRDGHLDRQRLLGRPSLDIHLPGMDTRALQERIARCVQQRPAVTTPPPPG